MITRFSLSVAALLLAAGAVVHASAYHGATRVIDASAMPAFYVDAYKALWLVDSINMAGLAGAFTLIAFRRASANTALILVLALAPFAVAATLYTFMGAFFAGHLMVASGALAIIAALSRRTMS
jgi:hypothetical protein